MFVYDNKRRKKFLKKLNTSLENIKMQELDKIRNIII